MGGYGMLWMVKRCQEPVHLVRWIGFGTNPPSQLVPELLIMVHLVQSV